MSMSFESILSQIQLVVLLEKLNKENDMLREALPVTIANLFLHTVGPNVPIAMKNEMEALRGYVLASTLHDGVLTLTLQKAENPNAEFAPASKDCDCPDCTAAMRSTKGDASEGRVTH